MVNRCSWIFEEGRRDARLPVSLRRRTRVENGSNLRAAVRRGTAWCRVRANSKMFSSGGVRRTTLLYRDQQVFPRVEDMFSQVGNGPLRVSRGTEAEDLAMFLFSIGDCSSQQ
jgi:hypothetical protein